MLKLRRCAPDRAHVSSLQTGAAPGQKPLAEQGLGQEGSEPLVRLPGEVTQNGGAPLPRKRNKPARIGFGSSSGNQRETCMAIDDFKGTTPAFLPEEFFDGRLEGWAVLESLVGGLQKRATITAEGRWDEEKQAVHFVETYRFDDGHEDTLQWTIHRLGPGK
jgi:Protein of unknown function (DUF3833)